MHAPALPARASARFVVAALAPLAVATLLEGCGDKSLENTPCETAADEQCEGTALLRCDGRFYVKLADCAEQCVTGPDVEHEGATMLSDETWTCAEGRHVVKGPISVGAGVTLTIEAGAHVRLDPATHIDVDLDGRIVADATEGAPVLVTSNDGQSSGFGNSAAGGLNLFAIDTSVSSTEPSLLRHVIIERGIHGLGLFGLSTTTTAPTIEDCTFRDNERFGILLGCNSVDAPVPDFEADGNQFFHNNADTGGGDVSSCE